MIMPMIRVYRRLNHQAIVPAGAIGTMRHGPPKGNQHSQQDQQVNTKDFHVLILASQKVVQKSPMKENSSPTIAHRVLLGSPDIQIHCDASTLLQMMFVVMPFRTKTTSEMQKPRKDRASAGFLKIERVFLTKCKWWSIIDSNSITHPRHLLSGYR